MKRKEILCLIVFIAVLLIGCSAQRKQNHPSAENNPEDKTEIYKDGIYVGTSRSLYISEPFWGKVCMTIENGSFTSISFGIRDSSLHETFTGEYKKHYEGNPLYVQQVINDWHGVQAYPKKLLKKQNPGKVDCITGATWSYNIFQASLKEALMDAIK